jgi:histidinol phosphatase-like enzyme (inositol monophosphatase family)
MDDHRRDKSDVANMTAELQTLVEFATEIARGAGDITLRYFRGDFVPERKADGSYVTPADREAERYLRGRIEERFPDDAILGEEEAERPGTSGRRWIIDPLDGTYSFVRGVPLYGVLIGVEIDDDPAVGVVNLPAIGELVHAARGLGCFLNGKPAQVSKTASIDRALLAATDFAQGRPNRFSNVMGELQRRFRTSKTWGDCYAYVLVATGRADVAIDQLMNVWDCAALMPIVEEAGGTFTDWKGNRTIRGGNAVATNGLLLDETLAIINSVPVSTV